jgi:hypothetical protein
MLSGPHAEQQNNRASFGKSPFGQALGSEGRISSKIAYSFNKAFKGESEMSRRRWSLSLNQKLVLLLAALAVAATIIGAFVSGHDWFSTTPSVSKSTPGKLTSGELAPDFSLADTKGNIVTLSEISSNYASVVLLFYRGYW